ncbi:MAG: Carbohydrate-selective porin OprB [Polaromonas sp.]|nr:Carbohydrate-selective porin OprB [Polaromonas sp.]
MTFLLVHPFMRLVAIPLLLPLAAAAQTEADTTPAFGFHAQATYIWQRKPAFSAAYTGPKSIVPGTEKSYSFTATADLGARLWQGAQLHFNPEGAQGVPLSNLTGAGGLSNGELQRGGTTSLKKYIGRLFMQQRFDVGSETEKVDADFNELGGHYGATRWTITAGSFSLLDYFDNNPYAKDPREQFMNWSFMTHGAWDYPADARGYTTAAMVEYRTPAWSVRAGRAMQPRESNGLALDRKLTRQYGDQLEVDGQLPVVLAAGPMRGRFLVFRNRIIAGSFDDALALGGVPDLSLVRRSQTKTGWGATLEAPLGEDAGLFVRASSNSGGLETYAFTEIDRQLSMGGQLTGKAWGRQQDRVGVAYAVNGLSASHRNYLAAGGQGAFLGDGKLNYDSERVLEAYYRWTLAAPPAGGSGLLTALSVGVQQVVNPGYNRDRGPVRVLSARLHTEF